MADIKDQSKDVSNISNTKESEARKVKGLTKSPNLASTAKLGESEKTSTSHQNISKQSSESTRPVLTDDDVDPSDEAKAESEKEHAEILRRKRDREGSLEPSVSSQNTPTDIVPSKKNRLQDAVIKEEQGGISSTSAPAAPSSPNLKSAETEKVGQIRKRVQDLSWKQRKEGDRDGQDEEEEEDGSQDGKLQATIEAKVEKPAAIVEEDSKPKRTQPSFSSFSNKTSGFAATSANKNNGASFLSSPTSAKAEKNRDTSPNATRSQPTFSSFSKSSSPFSTASNVAGPSWLAGKADSANTSINSSLGTTGGIRPSALGSVGSPSTSAQVTPPGANRERIKSSSPIPEKPVSDSLGNKKQLGFGAFASNKAFNSTRASISSGAIEMQPNGVENADDKKQEKTFDEALQELEESQNNTAETGKITTQFEAGQVDLRTGEEDEKTLTSARAKLYTMSEDKNWKERGTGTVRCNVGKEQGGTARLVMRSEGVLRLILNVNLFIGMKIHLEQDKFLRIVALEDEKLAHFAIKFANAATATNFYRIVKQAIPVSGDEWA